MKQLASSRRAVLLAAALAPASLTSAQCETAKITLPDASADGAFGRSVSVEGDWMAVGAADVGAPGVVHLLRREAGTWSFAQELAAPVPAVEDHFGLELELDGTTLAVGAPADTGSTQPGSVYLFELTPSPAPSWELVARIQPATDPIHSGYARSLALDGDTLAVSAYREKYVDPQQPLPYENDAGAVYLYRRDALGTWSALQKLVAPAPAELDWFGYDVELQDGVLAVGFPRDDDVGADFGSVRLYTEVDGVWTIAQTLVSPTPGLAANFGDGLALDDGRLVVASPGAKVGGRSWGVLDLFVETGEAWTHAATFDAGEPLAGSAYAQRMRLEGTRLLVGAPALSGDAVSDGAAFLFALEGPQPAPAAKLTQQSSGANHQLGFGVDLAGDEVLATAPGDDTFGEKAGAVQVWSQQGLDCATLFSGTGTLGVSEGGTQILKLVPAPEFWGLPYLVLGSLSGTEPGLAIHGVLVPLAFDAYTQLTISKPNQPPLQASFDTIPTFGVGHAEFLLPAGSNPAWAGLTVHHAYVLIDPPTATVVHASNALELRLVP